MPPVRSARCLYADYYLKKSIHTSKMTPEFVKSSQQIHIFAQDKLTRGFQFEANQPRFFPHGDSRELKPPLKEKASSSAIRFPKAIEQENQGPPIVTRSILRRLVSKDEFDPGWDQSHRQKR